MRNIGAMYEYRDPAHNASRHSCVNYAELALTREMFRIFACRINVYSIHCRIECTPNVVCECVIASVPLCSVMISTRA